MAVKHLSPVAASAKQLLARIERSTNAPALADQKNLVEANTTKIAVCTGLLKVLAAPTQSHEKIIDHIDSAVGCNIPLSKTMFIIRWGQAVLQNMMFNQYEAASNMVNRGSPEVVSMTCYVNIEGDMEGIACALVEGVLIRVWGKLKAADMHIKKKDET